MGVDHVSDWLKFLPLVWIGSSVLYCAARWPRFGSICNGALYYAPLAQVSLRGFWAKLLGISSAVAIDHEVLRVRMSFPQSVLFFFGCLHRDVIIRRAQIKSARLTSWMFSPAVEITYDDLGPTTMKLRVNDPDRVLAMLSQIGERT